MHVPFFRQIFATDLDESRTNHSKLHEWGRQTCAEIILERACSEIDPSVKTFGAVCPRYKAAL